MITSCSRGHEIYFDEPNNVWRYSDTNELADENRSCKRCGCQPTSEGYDACIGHIEGVTSACCGHGVGRPFIVRNKEFNMEEVW